MLTRIRRSVHWTEAVIGVLQRLNPELLMDDVDTVREISYRLCTIDVDNMERFSQLWPYREYSGMVFPGPYNAIMTMTPLLDDPRSHRTFNRAAALLYYTSIELNMPRVVLRAVQVMSWVLKVKIPHGAVTYFDNLGRPTDDPEDVPMSFVLPDQAKLRELLEDEGDTSEMGTAIGVLIQKYNRLSIHSKRSH